MPESKIKAYSGFINIHPLINLRVKKETVTLKYSDLYLFRTFCDGSVAQSVRGPNCNRKVACLMPILGIMCCCVFKKDV